jgi:predicted nucleotidyltransferase component of viral defense system
MQIDQNTFIEVSDALQMGNPAIVEKDYYVVALLKLLSVFSFDTHLVVLSGGTALAKSGIKTHRMSEDVDIKLIPQDIFEELSTRNDRKKARKQIYQKVINAIEDSNLFS